MDAGPRGPHSAVAIAGIALVAAVLAGTATAAVFANPAAGSPQPVPICGACGSEFAGIASDHGVSLQVEQSTVTVHVNRNGTATWTVTNRLANESTAERLGNDRDRLDRIANRAAREAPPQQYEGGAREVSARVDGSAVTITFTEGTGVRRTPGSILVVEYFHTRYAGGWLINAETITVVGPPGTEVTNDPTASLDARDYRPRVEERRVTWSGSVITPASSTTRLSPDDDVYVAFGPADGIAVAVVTSLGLALATAGVVAGNVAVFVLPPALVFGVLLAVAGRLRWPVAVRSLHGGAAVAVLGVVVLAHPLYSGLIDNYSGVNHQLAALGASYLLAGTVVGTPPWNGRVGPRIRALAVPILVVPATIALVYVLANSPYMTHAEQLSVALHFSMATALLALLVPFGMAVGRDQGYWPLLAWGAVVLAFAAGLGVYLPLTDDVHGLAIVTGSLAAVVTVVAGVPFVLLGRALAGPGGGDDSGGGGTDADAGAPERGQHEPS